MRQKGDEMNIMNLRKANIIFLLLVIISSSLVTACGSATSVKGKILDSKGQPFAEKTMILIPLLPEDQVKITTLRAGGRMTLVVPLTEWKPSTDDIVYERGYSGLPKWAENTNAAGEFVIKSAQSGKYVLLWLGPGAIGRVVYPIGAGGEFIRIVVQEGQINDLGTLTLMNFSEPVVR
jgi:hypothetical protein